MRKALVARGFVGMLSLVGVSAGLVGCGADVGDPSAEIGSTSEALTNASVVNQSHTFDNADQDKSVFGSACEVDDPTTPATGLKFMIAVGGIENAAGTAFSDDAVLYIPGTGYDANARTTFTGARANGFLIKHPTDPKSCLYIGGRDNSATLDQIVKLTVSKSGANFALTAANAGKLTVARSHVQAVKCGSGVLIMGGFGALSRASESGVMEVWNGETGTTAVSLFKNKAGSPATVTLNVPRGDFGADVSGADSTHIVIGGGEDTTGNLDTIEAIDTDASCNLDSTTATKPVNVTTQSPSSHTKLSSKRSGNASLYSSGSGVETWVFGPGSNSAAIDSVNIDWSNFTNANNTAPVSACNSSGNLVAVTNPLNIKVAADHLVIIGGTSTGQNRVQEYDPSDATAVCTTTTTDSSSTNLVNREGALGALVGSDVYYTAGRNGATFITTTFKVTP